MSGIVDSATCAKLAKLLGLIGSGFDGQALAAARKAEEIRRAAGLSWAQLLTGGSAIAAEATRALLAENDRLRAQVARLKQPMIEPPQPWRDSESYQDAAAACLFWRHHLTGWETSFLQSLTRQRKNLSPKQVHVMERIGSKVDAAIRADWRYRGHAAA
jgi:hypothetical protein